MAEHKETDLHPLPSPELLSPREATPLDGRSVTFAWEPVEGAQAYELEVATDAQFEQVVFSRRIEGQTDLVVADAFAAEGETYYWRVLAQNAAGWSSGERVESFIHTSKAAEQAEGTPDVQEDMGPASKLFKSSAESAAAEVSGDETLDEEGADHGVEHEGVEAGQIMGIALAVMAAVVMIIIVLFQMTGSRYRAARDNAIGLSGYPELRENNLQAQRMLSQYETVNDEGTVYRIPIDRAISLMVQEAYEAPGGSYTDELVLQPRRMQAGR